MLYKCAQRERRKKPEPQIQEKGRERDLSVGTWDFYFRNQQTISCSNTSRTLQQGCSLGTCFSNTSELTARSRPQNNLVL